MEMFLLFFVKESISTSSRLKNIIECKFSYVFNEHINKFNSLKVLEKCNENHDEFSLIYCHK